ncbi:hypothetical protein TrVE_jg1444 [Triparma verrucosa]|uniref:G-protein coupled receptors family 3 profile domain-containing protein n=1 Tax=Triparma verrucosa TaxID=1606542 RepID=A0A9W7CD52_9STRA|nr:hypothetical protein TrVE_jg1444 [Triparma verrucosa]
MRSLLTIHLLVTSAAAVQMNNLALMMRLSDLRNQPGAIVLSDVWRTVAMGAILAVKDFNARDARYTPSLADSDYASCDVQFNPTMYDSGSVAKGSILAYRAARADNLEGDGSYSLHSILGCARSDASKPMAILGGIDGIPQMSYWSTSDAMEDKSIYTNFGRSIPPDSATTKAAAELMSKLGYTYVGVSYVDDAYGSSWKDGFVRACSEMTCKDADGQPIAGSSCPIQVITSGLIGGNQDSVKQSVNIFKAANVKVGIVVTFDDDWNWWIEEAVANGMIGDDYFWVVGDGVMTANVIENANNNDKRMANGIGRLSAIGGLEGNPNFDKFLTDWAAFDSDADLKTYAESVFFDYVADAGHAANLASGAAGGWHPEGTDMSVLGSTFFADNAPDDVATYAYDAVMALGLGSCKYAAAGGTFDGNFDGNALFQKITQLNFNSLTNNAFFLASGSRDPASANFVLENFSCPASESCTSRKMGKWTAANGFVDNDPDAPFIYASGLTTPPADVVKPEEMLNLLSDGLITTGQFLVFLNYGIAATFAALTFKYQKHRVVRSSQPMFLIMVLVGCCVSTSAILAFGENDGGDYSKADDVNCMLQPTLYSLGFTFSFAALFAKITRIAKIFGNKRLSKVTITWIDMMKPIVALLLLDVVLLALWSSDEKAALKWERVPKTVDSQGNVLESVGMCTAENPWLYGALILALHFSVLVYGNYMCYKSRNVGTTFAEGKYVFMAMVSNLQIMALGLPMLIMVYDNPTSNYFMRTGIVFMNDVGVMLLIFVPKFYLILFGSAAAIQGSTATSNNTSSGQTSDGGDNQEMQALMDEIERLKQELADKE